MMAEFAVPGQHWAQKASKAAAHQVQEVLKTLAMNLIKYEVE